MGIDTRYIRRAPKDSSVVEPDPWPNGRNPNQMDPGPPVPGLNCHIVIDGVGYIFADAMDWQQESRQSIGSESTAPFFGDPANQLDTQASDLTMLLPLGQSDFSDGIGSQKLEIDPKGYESCNNLQLTPQNTLLNGPLINQEPIIGGSPQDTTRWWQEGYFGGIVNANNPYDYFGIGNYLYQRQNHTWVDIGNPASPITDLYGYSGHLLVCCGDGQSYLYSPGTPQNTQFLSYKGFTVNGSAFICYRDGRIYSAFLDNPAAISSVTTETSASVNFASYMYAVQYWVQLADTTWVHTRLGQFYFIDKPANQEIVLSILPTIGFHGGRVLRRLYRSHNNDSTNMYQLVGENTLLDVRVGWVDQVFDDTSLTVAYDWTTFNNTAMVILLGGTTAHNMANPDVSPIWFPESATLASTGDYVWQAQAFRDQSGNEACILGTTSGLFLWDGVSSTINDLRPEEYNPFNCFSLAINHGQVYFTLARTIVKAWNSGQEAFIEGPWYTQFSAIDEVRVVSAGEYVFFSVTGNSIYQPGWTVSIYRYDGKIFDWEVSYTYPQTTNNNTRPILGGLESEHSFAWYNNNNETNINIRTLDPRYNNKQTTNVFFRSSLSDCGLPRLRKQIFSVMVRYLQLSPQPFTPLVQTTITGATQIVVADSSPFIVGDWIGIDSVYPGQQEYRQITAIDSTNHILTLYHILGSPLLYGHAAGTNIYRCGAVVVLRNVFNDQLGTPQDIEVGGPYNSSYLFADLYLPTPVYSFLDGIQINWRDGTVMELVGWSMITGLNPPYYGKITANIRLQDYVKLPNSLFDNATALDRRTDLENAYNKGAVTVVDQFNQTRQMRFQELSYNYEEPKQRHADIKRNQATAHISLLDVGAELMKQESLVLGIPTNQ